MKRTFYIVLITAGFLLSSCVSGDFISLSGLSSDNFRMVVDQKKTRLYRLQNAASIEVCITNYGARVLSIMTPDKDGQQQDIVCGFDNISDYRRYRQNFGSVVGRYIGRILGARFAIDGTVYNLQAGSGGHCSHGGYPGFADRVWTVKKSNRCCLQLLYASPDGENGFPGNLTLSVTYRLTDDNELSILYEAETDKPTVLNPSNHSFFNLSGNLSRDVLDEVLWVDADSIAEYDVDNCVTGRMLSVKGTPFDFTSTWRIGDRIDEPDRQLAVTKGYDHTWKVNWQNNGLHKAALITDKESGRVMEVYTTEPGIHLYTANGHNGKLKGKQGITYPHRNAICFETMHFADSPNKPQFPTTLLKPGVKFRSETVFKFGVTVN